MSCLTFCNEILHRAGNLFHGNIQINPMLVEQIDHIGPQPFQRGLGHVPNILWPAIQSLAGHSTRKSELGGNDSFIELVRRAIQDRLTGQRPSMEVISEALHMSTCTLQRRLQESGSSFQRILDEARHQMARYYLSNSVLELNEAAYLLGFEDPNSFGRAFRNWEGVPPSDWRETHQVSAAN